MKAQRRRPHQRSGGAERPPFGGEGLLGEVNIKLLQPKAVEFFGRKNGYGFIFQYVGFFISFFGLPTRSNGYCMLKFSVSYISSVGLEN